MCGDTGVPRWYVKYRQRGAARRRPGRGGSRAAPRHREGNHIGAAASQSGPSAVAHRSRQQCRHQRAGNRICVPSRRRLDRSDDRAQRRPVRLGLPDAVSGRRHRGHQAVLSRYADRIREARSRLPAGHRRRRPRRVKGRQHGARQTGFLPAHGRLAQSRPENRRAGKRIQRTRQFDRHGRDGFHGLLDGGRLQYRGRLLPYRRHADVRPYVLPVVAPGLRAHHADGKVAFRTDPVWFTDYLRRTTVEWDQPCRMQRNRP